MRPGELLDARQFKVVEVYQTKGRPEERLSRLPEAGDDHVIMMMMMMMMMC